ncbi:hypothetical protein P8452_33092 [Trifolium repens]|nr:hypothetical protein P8452_33092 [Trifolium repens]
MSQGAGSSQGAMHGVSVSTVLAEPQLAPDVSNNIEAALPPLPPNQIDIKDLKLIETLFQNMTIEAGTCGASGSSATGGAPPAAGRTI